MRLGVATTLVAAALAPGFPLEAAGLDEAKVSEARVSLDLREADAQSVVTALLEASGRQVVFDAGIICRLTLKLHELSWLKAFEASLGACGLGYEEAGNVVRVATRERLRSELGDARRLAESRRTSRAGSLTLVRLSYARARELAPLLEKRLAPPGTVSYDERTNTLILTHP